MQAAIRDTWKGHAELDLKVLEFSRWSYALAIFSKVSRASGAGFLSGWNFNDSFGYAFFTAVKSAESSSPSCVSDARSSLLDCYSDKRSEGFSEASFLRGASSKVVDFSRALYADSISLNFASASGAVFLSGCNFNASLRYAFFA